MPELDSSGEKNNFASEDEVTKANVQAKLDETHALDRFYALPLMQNVEDTRADTEFFEWNSGQKVRIRQGTRTFIAALPDGDPQFMDRLMSWYGQDFGCYITDVDGNWVYNDKTGEVNPIPIDGNSWDVKMVKASDSEPFYIMIQFDFKQDLTDAELRYIPLADLDFDGRTSDLYGLLPLVLSGATTSGTISALKVHTDYGVPVSGLVTGDFTMYNVTDEASISVTDAAEDTQNLGSYTLTHDDLTAEVGDTVRHTVTKVKYQTGTIEVVVT